jgi:formylglycine-generating enzyme required for sulfatase activity
MSLQGVSAILVLVDLVRTTLVVCGGSWLYDGSLARSASRRGAYPPDYRYYDTGFRVVVPAASRAP